MDWLLRRRRRIERTLAARHVEDGSLVLCDLTSVYFEGSKCPLAKRGYSRDGRRGKLQIVFALLCDREGCPVAAEVFEGNTADPGAVASQVEKLARRFSLSRVVLVGDRGLPADARIREDLLPVGLRWITALRAPKIRKLVSGGDLQMSIFDERNLAEISSPKLYPGERLVVCRNPLLAAERARKREELLQATEAKLDLVVRAVKRDNRPLRGADNISVRADRALRSHKVAKHFTTTATEDAFGYERDEQKIAEEAALDGIYVIRTNVGAGEVGAEDAVRAYKSLSRVERAFRSFKGVDLKVRPVHHRLEGRVRAHVFLCMLAYHVEWHMRRALGPPICLPAPRHSRRKLSASSGSAHSPYPVAYTPAIALCHCTTITCPIHGRRTLSRRSGRGHPRCCGGRTRRRVSHRIPSAPSYLLVPAPSFATAARGIDPDAGTPRNTSSTAFRTHSESGRTGSWRGLRPISLDVNRLHPPTSPNPSLRTSVSVRYPSAWRAIACRKRIHLRALE